MSDFTIAVLIVLGLLAAYRIGYRIGYRNGIGYCMQQLKPLHDAAKGLAAMTRSRH